MAIRLSLLLYLSLIHVVAQAVDVNSRIDAVIVYPYGATVTRVADVDLRQGTNAVRLVGLVSSVDINQMQLELADSGVRIGQIKVLREPQREAYNTEIVELESRIYAQNRRIQALDDSSSAARLRLKFLDGIAQGTAADAAIEGRRGTADVNSWREALDLLQTAYVDANTLIRDNDASKNELVKDVSVLKRQLNELRGRSRAASVVELTLEVSQPLQTALRLHYFQGNARWSARYESRLNSATGELQLTQQAEVNQETDEAWNNVRLTLSTSEPGGELVAPEVRPEFLTLFDPVPTAVKSSATRQDSAAMFSMEEIVVAGNARAQVGNFAVNYDISGNSTIANNAEEPTNIDLVRHEFTADMITQVVPRRSTQAFLAARFVYDKTLPLYGGEMAVFVDGVFAGNTMMPTALPQSEIILPMGQDRRVEVLSQSQGDATGSGGIINRRKTEATDYIFEITNRRQLAAYVEVADRYPVARDRDIEVDIPRSATPPDESDIDNQPGVVLWKKTLDPGETWRIRHQYSIRYPTDRFLQRVD
jgi:uncharacterized protein (TIGR02231 family)